MNCWPGRLLSNIYESFLPIIASTGAPDVAIIVFNIIDMFVKCVNNVYPGTSGCL